jgi:DNA-binding SARP family transcriptional activator
MPPTKTGEPAVVRFGVLGRLRVVVDGVDVPLGARKQQLTLALLLTRANAVTSVDRLIDTLWPDDVPRTARKNVQVYVAGLRKLLGDTGGGDRIEFGLGGYRLRAEPAELDALRFAELVAAGRRAVAGQGPAGSVGSVGSAAALGEALALWRGPVLEGLAEGSALAEEAERIATLYPAAFEDWAEAALAAGDAVTVAERIDAVAGRHPFRERLRGLQMTALLGSGRPGEALAVFDGFRQLMARELGLEPGPALRATYQQVLRNEPPAAVPGRAGAPPARGRPPVASGSVHLPPDAPDFVGRESEIGRLSEILDGARGRLVVLGGPAGVGTTALAVHVAHRLAGRFPDGQVLVRLRTPSGRARPDAELLDEVLRVTGTTGTTGTRGTRGEAGAGPGRAWPDWQDWLRSRRVLLVLDGASCTGPLPADLLPGPASPSAVLVTGRLRDGERRPDLRVDLGPLSVGEAVELLAAIAGPERVDADRVAAGRIVERIGRRPSAVRGAGLKIRRLRHLPLADFAARLADPATLLEHLSTGECDLVAGAAAWFTGLPAGQRAAVQALAGLPGPRFGAAQALERLGGDARAGLRMLETLIEDDVVTVPDADPEAGAEVVAHQAEFELPPLAYAYLRSGYGT